MESASKSWLAWVLVGYAAGTVLGDLHEFTRLETVVVTVTVAVGVEVQVLVSDVINILAVAVGMWATRHTRLK